MKEEEFYTTNLLNEDGTPFLLKKEIMSKLIHYWGIQIGSKLKLNKGSNIDLTLKNNTRIVGVVISLKLHHQYFPDIEFPKEITIKPNDDNKENVVITIQEIKGINDLSF